MEREPGRRSFIEEFRWQAQHRKVKPPPRATRADLFIGVPFCLLVATAGVFMLADAFAHGAVPGRHHAIILRAQDPGGFAFQCLVYALLTLAALAAAVALVVRYRRRGRKEQKEGGRPR